MKRIILISTILILFAAPAYAVPGDCNRDGLVDAGDISCTVLLIFNGPGACVP